MWQFLGILTWKLLNFSGNDIRKLINFQVIILGYWSIFKHCYPRLQIGQFLGIITHKLTNFWILLPVYCYASEYCYPEIYQLPNFPIEQLSKGNLKFPGNNTQKLKISRYCYSEIVKFPGNNTRKCNNFQVLLPWSLILQPKLENLIF